MCHYEGIKLICQVIAEASLKVSVESVVESVISNYENHFHKNRNVKEDTAVNEMEIIVNGPELSKSNKILRSALEKYFDGKPWHFYKNRKGLVNIMEENESAVVKRLQSQGSKFVFLE